MNDTLNELISLYRDAQTALIKAQDADQAAFDKALAACREIRAQINAQCPASSLAAGEFNITEQIR